MKKKITSYVFIQLYICFTLLSCSQDQSSPSPSSPSSPPSVLEPIVTPKRQASDGISLEGDTLWKVNQATNDGVTNMNAIIKSFSTPNRIETYSDLHAQLENEILTIFTKCNMTGEGHNQLHNFLLPLYEHLEQLQSKDLSICQNSLMEFRKRLALYPLYFE